MINRYLLAPLILFLFTVSCKTQPSNFIAVNQVGYHPEHQKQAFLVHADADSFVIINNEDKSIAFSGISSEPVPSDKATGDILSILDFTLLKEPGEYYIRLNNKPDIRSHSFMIAE